MRLNRLSSLTKALIIAATLSSSTVSAQQGNSALTNKYALPYYLDCGREPPYKSQSARSRVLSSADDKREAYAEVKARAASEQDCTNTSAVLVRQGSGAFDLIFFQAPIAEPTGRLDGNGVKLIDWSKDGAMLLFDVLRWNYSSDAPPGDDLWIYYARDGALKQVPLRTIFRRFGDGCAVSFEPLGFSETGEVLVQFSAKQGYDVDGEPNLPKCEAKRVAWLFDPGSSRLTQAPYNSSVQKWGKIRSP